MDILERLRDAAQHGDLKPEQSDLYLEALDEIERLRMVLEDTAAQIKSAIAMIPQVGQNFAEKSRDF